MLAAAPAHGAPGSVRSARVAPAGHGILLTGDVFPVDGEGRLAGADIATQTRWALANLDTALKARGGSLERAASLQVVLRHAADFPAMNTVYAAMFSSVPPARTTVVGEPALAGALIQVSAVGLTADASREVVHPASWPRSPLPYSYGIKSGDTLFLAGLVARRGLDNVTVEGDVAAQTGVVFENAVAILHAAGMSLADVVSSRVFITDASSFQQMNEAYRSRLPEPRPVRTTVVCPLISADFKVEITMVASTRAKRLLVPPLADGTPATVGPNFSPALANGDRLHLSGALGNTPTNAGDVAAQTRVALASLERGLRAGGATWADVTDVGVFLVSLQDAPSVHAVLRQVLARDDVPTTTVGVGLVVSGAGVEVVVGARVPPHR
jgi:enamine deaminase RidA (YjgF/YER057c/UK114 family)